MLWIRGKDAQFFEVKCPNCGRIGKIRIRRLDRSFNCLHCASPFHIRADGRAIAGRGTRNSRAVEPLPGHFVGVKSPLAGPLSRWWSRASKKTKAGLVTFGMGMVGALLWLLIRSLGGLDSLPPALEDRAIYYVRSALAEDWRSLRRLTIDDTWRDAREWVDSVQRTNPSGKFDPDDFDYHAEVIFNRREIESETLLATAGVVIRFAPRSDRRPTKSTGETQVILVWSQGLDQVWLLDGEKTLQEASAAR